MKKGKILGATLVLTMVLSTVFNMGIVKAEDRVDQILESMTIEEKIGQMIMPDFRQWKQEGETKITDLTVMNDEVAQIIDQYDFGGVILFANNVKATEQTLKLTTDMQEAAIQNKASNGDIPLLLTIDQEGGIVYRLGSGTALPGNMALGATDDEGMANMVGEVIGRELSALGINVNFAPVFDTNNNPNNPVIGLRSISSNPELVAKLGVPMMKGMQKYNVATAAKHFPGHGDTATDSHTGLPKVDKSYDELAALELVPFQKAVDNGVDMLMTAHIQYPQIEKDTVVSKSDGSKIFVPATLSDDIITGVVREKMGYDGIVVTDAMNMDAIAKNFGEAEAVIMAMQADVDICLMPTILRSKQDVSKIDHIFDEVKNALAEGDLSIDTLNRSVKRILSLKETRGILDYTNDDRTWQEKLDDANKQVGSKENRDIEREVSARSVTVVKNENNILPLKPQANEKVLLLGAYDNELPGMELSMRRLIDEGVVDTNVQYESIRYNSGTMISDLKAKIDQVDYVIVISEVGSTTQMLPTNWLTRVPTEVIDYANQTNKKAVIMSISKPYDVANYPNAKAVTAVYGNKGMDPTEGLNPDNAFGPNIPAGIEVIFGGHKASGKLPVDVFEFSNGSFNDKIVYPIGHGLTYDAVNLVESNKVALSIAIEVAKDYTDDKLINIIPAVVNEFKAALANGEEVYANKRADQDTVDLAFARLARAIHMLEFYKGDKTDLNKLVDSLTGLKEADYTTESWSLFAEALQGAKDVIADENALQVDVEDAYKELNEAFGNLKLRADKTKLENFVNKVMGIDGSKYTNSTYQVFTKALENANLILEKENATQSEIDNVYNELIVAYLNLRLIPDKNLLQDLINQAQLLSAVNYTPLSWQNMVQALDHANEVLADLNADEATVNAALDKLQLSINNLVLSNSIKTGDSNKVKNSEKINSINTGDSSKMLEIIGLASSLAIMTVLIKKKKIK